MKQSLEITKVELNRSGTYISFSDGAAVSEGDTFDILRPRRHFARILPERSIGKVRVVRIEGPGRFGVEVLSGTAFGGTSAKEI